MNIPIPHPATLDAPDAPPAPSAPDTSALGLVEALLKHQDRVDAILVEGRASAELVTRFLAITLVGFTAFGLVLAVMLNLTGADVPYLPRARWADGSALWPILAYDVSVIAACGVCLPSFYFYNLLAGVRLSMVDVVAHATRALARSAIVLVGLLPLWVAVMLGQHVFGAGGDALEPCLVAGVLLPFIAGLSGVAALYRGFAAVAAHQRARKDGAVVRVVFLERLLLAWAGVWTAITPIMIHTLWTALAGQPGLAAQLSGGR